MIPTRGSNAPATRTVKSAASTATHFVPALRKIYGYGLAGGYTQWSQTVCFNAAKLFTAFITSRSITALLDKTLLF